jgi:hypothetical protein
MRVDYGSLRDSSCWYLSLAVTYKNNINCFFITVCGYDFLVSLSYPLSSIVNLIHHVRFLLHFPAPTAAPQIATHPFFLTIVSL